MTTAVSAFESAMNTFRHQTVPAAATDGSYISRGVEEATQTLETCGETRYIPLSIGPVIPFQLIIAPLVDHKSVSGLRRDRCALFFL